MIRRLTLAAAAMLLVTSCIRENQARPDASATHQQPDAAAIAAKKAADDKAAADAAAAKKAADDKAAVEAADKLAKAKISSTTNSGDAAAAFETGLDWFFTGHLAKARAQFEKATSLDSHFLRAQMYLALITAGAEAMKNAVAVAEAGAALPEAERTELQLNAASKTGDSPKADELETKLAAIAPGDWSVQLLIGFTAEGKRDLDAAAKAFQKAADLNPGAASPHTLLAQLANLRGDRAAEAAEYQKASAVRPDEPVLRDDLAGALIGAGKLDEAAAAIAAEQAMPGAGWEPHASLSALDILRGDFAGGLKEARAAHEAAKDEMERYDQQDRILVAQLIMKKYGEALKTAAAEEAEAKGKNPNYYVNAAIDRGLIRIDEGKYTEAAAALEEALKRTDSEHLSGGKRADLRLQIFELLAWADASAGKAEAAQAAADMLQKEAGADAQANVFIASMIDFAQGEARLAKKDTAGAIASMSKCVPELDLCRWALAAAQEKSGDAKGAQATRTAFLELIHYDMWSLWVRARIAPKPTAAKKS